MQSDVHYLLTLLNKSFLRIGLLHAKREIIKASGSQLEVNPAECQRTESHHNVNNQKGGIVFAYPLARFIQDEMLCLALSLSKAGKNMFEDA